MPRILIVILIGIALSLACGRSIVAIKDIHANPDRYLDRAVTLRGRLTHGVALPLVLRAQRNDTIRRR